MDVEKLFRSRKFWIWFIIGAYLVSALWGGVFIILVPLTLYWAPAGILHLLSLIGVISSEPKEVNEMIFGIMHAIFWPTYVFLIVKAKDLDKRWLYTISVLVILAVLLTLGGCAHGMLTVGT